MRASPALASALLLVAMASAEYAGYYGPVSECKHGETKQIDCCNNCACSQAGKWECTEKLCPGKQEVEIKCKPGSVFKRNCNNCTCNSEGTKACCTTCNCTHPWPWKPGCPVPECKPGDKKQIDCCNNCTCSETAKWMCTTKICPGIKEVEIKCKPYSVFKRNCNNCTCNSEGKKACCTTCNCTHPWPSKPGCPVPECKPGDKKQIDCCNNCTCSQTANWMCTKKYCPNIKEVEIKCKPGSVFKRHCNNCTCNSEGKKACCTTCNCTHPWPGKEGCPIHDCKPGDKKQKDCCNNCTCSKAAKWVCTHKPCHHKEEVVMKCKSGAVFEKDCNKCTCNIEGTKACCTTRNCSQPYHPGSYKEPTEEETNPESILKY